MDDNKKQSNLNKLIEELSTNPLHDEEISVFVNRFKAIYDDGFRHSYSSLTGLMLRISKDNDGAFGVLLDNLSAVREETNENSELDRYLAKLYDHLSLENIRLDQLNEEYNRKIAELRYMVKYLEAEEDRLKKLFTQKIDKLEEEANKSKTEVVTILSIFAAIVLAFMGGMSFTSSTFTGIASVSIYRLIGVEIICGLVIFNTISTLIYLVSKIVGKKISVKCKTEECSCEKECWAFNKLRKKYPLIFWFNALMMALLFIDVIAWCVDASAVVECIRRGILN